MTNIAGASYFNSRFGPLGAPAPVNPFDFTGDNLGPLFSTNVVDTNFTAPAGGVVTAISLAVFNGNATDAQFTFTVPPTPTGSFTNAVIPANSAGVIRYVFDTPFSVVAGQTFGVNPQNGNGFSVYASTLPTTVSNFNFGSDLPVASGIEYQ